ncbi:MAG TPA: hypothetical protein VFU15_05415, partial [Bacteroidia bacterium]|nr:hypothetical protein [Bacteroidia bacterium]
WGMVNFFLAFLSKEYAVVLIPLIPAGLMIFHKRKFSDLLYLALPIAGVVLLYVICRIGSVGLASQPVDKRSQDPLNDPYLYATSEQRIASKLNRLDDYIKLLIYPFPLVSDYSYQHFPYSRLSDPDVLLSMLLCVLILPALTIWLWIKRSPYAFAMLIYLGFFALVCNIFFDIGATMGERLIYHSSLGFCMIVAMLLVRLGEVLKESGRYVVTGIFLLISIPAWMLTTKRNLEWKNDFTLFTSDVKKHPNSALCNGNAGARYMDLGLKYVGHDSITPNGVVRVGRNERLLHAYADTAMTYLLKAVELHKKYVNGYLNLGLCYYYKDDYENAASAWGNAYLYFPSNPILLSYEQMLIGKANERASKKDFAGAERFFKCAVTTMPNDYSAWSNLAGSSFMARDFATSANAFQQAINLKPDMKNQLINGLRAATSDRMRLDAWKKDSSSYETNLNLGLGYTGTTEFYPESRRLLNKALVAKPGDARVTFLLDSLSGLEQKAAQSPKSK